MMCSLPTNGNPIMPNDVTTPGIDSPHGFLLAVVRGETVDGTKPTLSQRIEAAKAAAPYFAPRLAAVAHVGPDGGPIRHSIEVRFIRPGEALP